MPMLNTLRSLVVFTIKHAVAVVLLVRGNGTVGWV
jgi:hypothetical protein